jgi:hypothetical protein
MLQKLMGSGNRKFIIGMTYLLTNGVLTGGAIWFLGNDAKDVIMAIATSNVTQAPAIAALVWGNVNEHKAKAANKD